MLESAVPTDLRGNQRPGLLHLPDGIDTHVDDALYLCGEWGFGYDEWQEFSMVAALREQPDGRWAAKELGLEVSRQNGKGELVEGREALGLFYLDERKLIHSAHEFATASEALDRMDDRIGQNPQLKRRVKSVKRSHGEEGVYLRDGRKLLYKTRTKGGGRGFGADFLAMDEAMFIAEAFLGALMPVISARPNPQMWYMGSAVDEHKMEHGVVFARLRQRALEGRAGRMAYLGWSPAYERDWETPADVPREATADPHVIAEGNPALGIRIDLEHIIETEREAMDHDTFCVERLGVGYWPAVDEEGNHVIDLGTWADRVDAGSEIHGRPCFVFDVTPDRSRAAIGAAGARRDGGRHVETVEHDRGTGWVEDRVMELAKRWKPLAIGCDANSPAASLIEGINQRLADEKIDLEVVALNSAESAQAFGMFYDDVDQGHVRHLGTPELEAALRGAARQQVGDAWKWSRKHSGVDISPLVTVTLANWLAATTPEKPKAKPAAVWR